jgi:molybdopterin synthase sulfur carrier subunit
MWLFSVRTHECDMQLLCLISFLTPLQRRNIGILSQQKKWPRMQSITVQVRLFAAHRDIVGRESLTMQVPYGTTLGDIWQRLVDEYPRLGGYTGHMLYAVNEQYSDPIVSLSNGDYVAFIPPVSGGRDMDLAPTRNRQRGY